MRLASPPNVAAPAWTGRTLGALAAITLVAAVLRLWGVRDWSFDVAEAATFRALQLPLGGDAGFYAAPESRAPLLHLLLRALVDHGMLPSLGEGSLRLPFVFLGLLTVPVLGLVLRRWCGPGVAIAAALLLALHPLHVQASQTAATPVVVPLLVLLAAAAFHGERPRWFAGAALVLLAGLADPLGYAAVLTAWRRPGHRNVVRVLPWLALGLLLLGGALPAWRWPLLALAGFGLPLLPWPVQLLLLAPAVLAPFAPAEAALAALPGGITAAVLAAVDLARRFGATLPVAPTTTGRATALLAAWLAPALVAVVLAIDTFLLLGLHQGARPPWRDAARVVLRAYDGSRGLWVGAMADQEVLRCYLRPKHWCVPGSDPHPHVQVQALPGGEEALAALQDLQAMAAERQRLPVLVLRTDELAALPEAARTLLAQRFVVQQLLAAATAQGDRSLLVLRGLDTPP
jgi:hypothetical protein